jgi:hypothetical protein
VYSLEAFFGEGGVYAKMKKFFHIPTLKRVQISWIIELRDATDKTNVSNMLIKK